MKEKKKVQFHIHWNKMVLAIVVAFSLMFGIMVFHFRTTYHDPTEVYHASVKYEFMWDGTTYKGIYDGDFQNTQPNGYGTFEDSEGRIKYTGIWQRGLFIGVGMVIFADGSVEVGEFLEGKRNGTIRSFEAGALSDVDIGELTDRIRSIYEDVKRLDKGDTYFNLYYKGVSLGKLIWREGDIGNSYNDTFYEENSPYARSDTYENGQLVSTDYYICGFRMSQIIKEAKPLSEKLIKKEKYYNKFIYIDGEVEFSGETSTKSLFRFNSDKIGMIYCGYDSTYGNASDQAYVPELKNGDKIRVYGYYMGLSSYNVFTDKNGNSNKLSKIKPLLVVKQEDFVNESDDIYSNSNMVFDDYIIDNGVIINRYIKDGQVLSYNGILGNPYFYSMEKIEDIFVIKNVKKTGVTYTITSYKEGMPDELYSMIYEGDIMDTFLTGSSIKVSGYLMGQTRKITTQERDKIIEDGILSEDLMTYEFDKQLVIKAEEIIN